MAKTLQLRRGTTAEITANTPASGELFVDTQKKTVTVGDGSTAGGIILARNDRVSDVFTAANGANGLAAGAFTTANGANGLASGAYNQANVAIGVDTTQNTRINSIETINTNQNNSITIIQGVDSTQNVRLNSIETINTNQNTTITAVNQFAAGAFNQANTAVSGLSSKQATLVSGTNIKTINENSVLGSGNITVSADTGNFTFTANTIRLLANQNAVINVSYTEGGACSANYLYPSQQFTFESDGTFISQTLLSGDLFIANNIITAMNTVSGSYNTPTEQPVIINSDLEVLKNLTVSGNVDINISSIHTNTANLTSNSANQVIDSFDSRLYRTVRYIIQGINYENVQSMGVMLSHDNANVYIAQYDTIGSNTSLYTVSSNLSSNIVSLLATPANLNTFFDVVRTSIVARTLTPFVPPPPPPPVWSAGGNMSTARDKIGAAGTPTATLGFGGYVSAAKGPGMGQDVTEEYDGSTWSGGGALPTITTNHAGAGTQTAGLSFGGFGAAFAPLTVAQEYDGSAWASGGSLGSSRYGHGGCGTQTAALGVGGKTSPAGVSNQVVLYDGTSWSTGGPPTNLATGRDFNAVFGTQSAAVTSGGRDGSFVNLSSTENWNGSVWSAGGALPTATFALGGSGTQTAGLTFGGMGVVITAAAQTYNGSTWTTAGSLITARFQHGGAGTAAGTGIAFGGSTGSYPSLASTEVYS